MIYTVIKCTDPEKLKMGQPVRLDTMELDDNGRGGKTIAYRFAPVEQNTKVDSA